MWKKRLVEEDEDAPNKKRKKVMMEEDDDDDNILVDDDAVDADYDSADEYDEDLYKGPADKSELLAKSALEMEMILAERHERKQRRVEVLQIRAEARDEAARARNAASGKESKSRSSKARAATSASEIKNARMAELALKRQQSKKKQQAEERRREEEAAEDDDDDDAGLVDDDDPDAEEGELDEEEAPPVRSSGGASERKRREADEAAAEAAVQESAAPLLQLERIRLTRRKLEKWINEPFFETVVPGCFVRIGIGSNGSTPMYRLAEIVGVKDGFRQYSIETTTTTKRLELAIGASKRYFQINYVSNTDFDPQEVDKYGRIMKGNGLKTKTLTQINEKVKDLLDAKNHVYSEAEISAKVEHEKGTQKMKGNLARQRNELQADIEATKQARDLWKAKANAGEIEDAAKDPDPSAKLAKLEGELSKLDDKKEIEMKIEQKREKSSFRINDINNRNKEFRKKVEEEEGRRNLQEDIDFSAGRTKVSDPFKRLPIRPVIYWTTGAEAKNAAEAEKAAAEAAAAKATEEASKAAASGAGSSSDPLTVSTDVQATGDDPLVSPGFQNLIATPRADGEPALELDAEGGGGALAMGGADGAGADGAMPKLAGKRAQAHATMEIDIDITEEADAAKEAAAQPAYRRSLLGSRAPRPATGTSGGGEGTGGARLSLKDYKKRLEAGLE